MRWVIGILLVAACSHPPPKHVAAAEEPVTGAASFAGTWLMNDDMDWGYRLVLVPDGRFALAVDRGKGGPCEQRGRLAQQADPKHYTLTLTKDTCGNGAVGGALPVAIGSFTGDALTLVYSVGTTEMHRAYQRDPKVPRK